MKLWDKIMEYLNVEKPEEKQEEKPETNWDDVKQEIFQNAPQESPLDKYDHAGVVAMYYWIHARVHGIYLSQDMARHMYEAEKHIILETLEYAKRLPEKEEDESCLEQ